MREIKPIFMWAGGKSKLIKNYESIIPKNGFDTFVEPYFGGGAVFLWIKQNNPDVKCIINDINEEIIGIYKNIKFNPIDFNVEVEKIEKEYLLKSTKQERKEFFYLKRKEYWAIDNKKLFDSESSSLLYFLMKTAFNGIWQICSDSKGRFGTPFGLGNQKNKIFDQEQILLWSNLLSNVDVKSQEATSLIIPENSMIYADPPYVDSFTTYGTKFDINSQKALAEWAYKQKENGNRIFVSNRDTEDHCIEQIFPNSKIHKFPITYTAGRRKHKTDESGNKSFEAKKAVELLIDV